MILNPRIAVFKVGGLEEIGRFSGFCLQLIHPLLKLNRTDIMLS